jgi:2-keto-4-pentenoate hydratase/2-oxohepta-3-ene-1,7-dioic acid hydratase in catechol pathway
MRRRNIVLKLVTFEDEKGIRLGVWQGVTILDLRALWSILTPDSIPDWIGDMSALIKAGPAALESIYALLDAIESRDDHSALEGLIPQERIHLLAPIPRPHRNILCVGLNYHAHSKEGAKLIGRSADPPQFPVFFTKAPTSVVGPEDPIFLDPKLTQELDYEVELGVVIGLGGRNIDPEEAMAHVFGYIVINDISARDVQRRHGQWFKGKSLDGTCPMGPCLIPARDIHDPHTLDIGFRLNGEVMQESNTRHLIFKIPVLIAELSRGMTLEAGDIIATGTPGGVGFARNPPIFLKEGDQLEAWVKPIGQLNNKVQIAPWVDV